MLRCGPTLSWPSNVGGAPTASAVRIRDRFVGTPDLGAVGFAGLWADFRRPLPRSVLRCDLIRADMAAELALVSSGMTIPLSRAIFSANDTCAGLAGLEPSSPEGPPPPSYSENDVLSYFSTSKLDGKLSSSLQKSVRHTANAGSTLPAMSAALSRALRIPAICSIIGSQAARWCPRCQPTIDGGK